jgi:hypothetical protein
MVGDYPAGLFAEAGDFYGSVISIGKVLLDVLVRRLNSFLALVRR